MPAFVTSWTAYSTTGTECDVPVSPAAGDLLFVAVMPYNVGSGVIALADNLGSSWTKIGEWGGSGADGVLSCWYLAGCPSGLTAVKVTGVTSGYASVVVEEYSGCAATSPLDVAQGTYLGAAATSAVSPSITTTGAAEVVVSASGDGNVSGTTRDSVTSPWSMGSNSQAANNTNSEALAVGHQIGASAGAYACTHTWGGSFVWRSMTAAFKAGAAGPADPFPLVYGQPYEALQSAVYRM